MKDIEVASFSAMVDEHLSVEIPVRNSLPVGEPMILALDVVADDDNRLLFLSGEVGGHMLVQVRFVNVAVIQTLSKGYLAQCQS
jgi:hypothetical protein